MREEVIVGLTSIEVEKKIEKIRITKIKVA